VSCLCAPTCSKQKEGSLSFIVFQSFLCREVATSSKEARKWETREWEAREWEARKWKAGKWETSKREEHSFHW
jgi:hypothetical protein